MWRDALISLGLAALNFWLHWRAFLPGIAPWRGTIAPGYASFGRFFAENPDMWGWNPLNYCGLPSQFTYLPGLPYLNALLLWLLPSLDTLQAFRVLTVTSGILLPVAVYFCVRAITNSIWWSLLAALGSTFASPVYPTFEWKLEGFRQIFLPPWRFQLLTQHGEGPHVLGFLFVPVAVGAVWLAGLRHTYRHILFAAAALAVVALINWVAALALAVACLLILLAVIGWKEFHIWRVLAAGALGYLLACFWLTPSFILIITTNWPKDAYGYQVLEPQRQLLPWLFVGVIAIRLLFLFWPDRRYLCFLAMATFAFGYLAAPFYLRRVYLIPESHRYALEYDSFAVLLFFEFLRQTFGTRRHWVRLLCVTVIVWAYFWQRPWIERGFKLGWSQWKTTPIEVTPEYRVAKRLEELKPAGRVYVSGETRFRLNAYTDLDQAGGTFETGLTNRTPIFMEYQIKTGLGSKPEEEGADAVLQLRTMAVEYVAVHGPKSKEFYRDLKNPRKYENVVEAVWRDGDDVIYRVGSPRLAVLVHPAEMIEVPFWGGGHKWLAPYVAAMDDPSRPKLQTAWRGPSALTVEGAVPAGMQIAVAVNHYPGWRALQDGRPIRIEKNNLGFMTLHPSPSSGSRIEMAYHPTGEQIGFAILSILAWIAALGGLVVERRRRPVAQ